MSKHVTKEAVLNGLGVTHDAWGKDLDICLNLDASVDEDGQDRMKWVLRNERFQAWLKHPTSDSIIVNGNQAEVDKPTSFPMTNFAAKLLDSLNMKEQIFTLHFFCALHTKSKEGIDDNATGMLRSLISQLLQFDFPWDANFGDLEDVHLLKEHRPELLYEVLGDVLAQIPPGTHIFCVIADISLYEGIERSVDFCKALQEIADIVRKTKNLTFKLLLASHNKSQVVSRITLPEDKVDVPIEIFDGDFQGLSKQVWDREMKECLDKLLEVIKDEKV